jgi:hypothetical protein
MWLSETTQESVVLLLSLVEMQLKRIDGNM